MSEVAPPKREPASWRIWLFRILAALWGLYFGSNVAAVIGPWISSAPNGGMDPALGRWETNLGARVAWAACTLESRAR